MNKTIVGLYEDTSTAQSVVRELTGHGFRREDISLVANDTSGELGRGLPQQEAEGVSGGAATGAGVGAVLGGLGGLLVGLGALAIPGIGPIIAAGPIAAALAGAGIGAVTGGLIGALVDAGIPEEEAHLYDEGVRRGGILVMVNSSEDMARQAGDIMGRFNPINITERSAEWERSGWKRSGESTSAGTGIDRRASVTEDMTNRGTMRTDDFETYDPDFRRHYESSFAGSGYDYSHFQPAYRYGYDLAGNKTYADWEWTQLEQDARRDWLSNHPDSKWEEFKEAVREGWDSVRGRR